jgi:uncharacterized membrane protein YbhN (UPF0104 family)
MGPSQPAREDAKPNHGGRKLAIRVAKWIIAAIVVVGLALAARSAIRQWESERSRIASSIVEIDRQLENVSDPDRRRELQAERQTLAASLPRLGNLRWDRITLALFLYAVALVPPAMLLRSALHCLDQRPSLGTAIAAQLIGHAGKYVPGKAMVIVLRATALASDGVTAVPATVSIFLETFLMMAVGASVAAIVMVWLPVPTWMAVASVGVALLACLPTLPPILRQVARRVTKMDGLDARARINWRLFAAGWGWSLLSWLLVGASFAALVAAMPGPNPLPPPPQLYAIATAAICLAVVAGFASLIPGGAGVRELVLTTILGVSIGPAQGILAAIAARVAFMGVESAMAAASWIYLRQRRRSQLSGAQADADS